MLKSAISFTSDLPILKPIFRSIVNKCTLNQEQSINKSWNIFFWSQLCKNIYSSTIFSLEKHEQISNFPYSFRYIMLISHHSLMWCIILNLKKYLPSMLTFFLISEYDYTFKYGSIFVCYKREHSLTLYCGLYV